MTKRVHLLLISVFMTIGAGPALAQEWIPELTEKWEPVPVIVTPGEGDRPPSDAIVLFDGSSLSAWEKVGGGPAAWSIEDGAMTAVLGAGGVRTTRSFGSVQLHIEWRTPAEVVGDGQGRGNSGVFLQEKYEVQVLDSYDNVTYSNGQAGSIYKQHIPLVNASRGPGEWQIFDIVYTAPFFDDDGTVIRPAFLTVMHNGVLIQNHVELSGPTEYIGIHPYTTHGDLPLMLQNHGNPVSFRNIWIREL